MESCRRDNHNCNSNAISVVLSLIFGVIIGVLFYFALLPFIFIGITLAVIVAIVALILFWRSITSKKLYSEHGCICENFGTLLTGIIGTLVSAFIILSLFVVAFSVIYAILVGLAAFFFALTLVGIISYLGCLADCDCDCDCKCN